MEEALCKSHTPIIWNLLPHGCNSEPQAEASVPAAHAGCGGSCLGSCSAAESLHCGGDGLEGAQIAGLMLSRGDLTGLLRTQGRLL